ncbi:IS630 family transposase [Streptomyces olivoreticuli]|uniref:IS630 family transposase n=1 Tax=Streptomyces olivoreticuli TaxID=68246 RepID=UPI002659389F|nr:IS630 family transposase [Streptomyces olivoreticuli]WKK24069.1 IS630 family transposase [Streptomyces olivoreticuli]
MVMRPLRVELSPTQVAELQRRLRARDLVPNERMRLECVRLAAQGRTAPAIASVVEKHVVTVRKALHRFLDGGFDALADAPRPGRSPRWNREDLDMLEAMLDASAAEGRIWTLPALAEWLRRERGVVLDSSWLSVLLHRDGFRWKRTRDSIRHQVDPALQAAAEGRLEGLRLRSEVGVEDLYYLDECGFSPTLPTGYTWARTGTRVVVRREDTKNRRVNVIGALNNTGPEPELVWMAVEHRLDAAMVLDFVCAQIARLPGGADRLAQPPPDWKRRRPCIIVLDNASIHRGEVFMGRRQELAAIGVRLFYLPPRSPELNRIEPVWRSVKYQDMPVRAYTTTGELRVAVDRALAQRAAAMAAVTAQLLKIA